MKKLIALLLLSKLFVTVVCAQDFYFKHLGVKDGLSQLSILSIYQDEIGAVWLGTTEGLNRYNGEDMQIFRASQTNSGLTNNEINELCGNGKGTMFMRSGNDLVSYDLYKEKFTRIRQNEVNGLCCEKDTLWFISEHAIYYYSIAEQRTKLFARLPKGSTPGRAIYVNHQTVWALTLNSLFTFNKKDGTQKDKIGAFDRAKCIYQDKKQNIWVGTWNGLYRITPQRSITTFTANPTKNELSDNQVRSIVEDDYGSIWVGTFRGLDCYNPATEAWRHYTRYSDASNTLSHNSIFALHKDIQGNIWVGTYYGGANIFNPNRKYNHFYYAEPQQADCLSFPVVGRMTEDGEHNLWICTEGGGLNLFNPQTGKFKRYLNLPQNANSIGNNNLKCIFYNKGNNSLYIGTHTGGLSILNLANGRIHTLSKKENQPQSLPNNIVNEIQEYKSGLAILTQGGVSFFNTESETFAPLSSHLKIQQILNRSYEYETFFIDSRQRIWLALSKGGIIQIDLTSSAIKSFTNQSLNQNVINRFKTVHISEDEKGDLYFSTIGSGLFKYDQKQNVFKAYNVANQAMISDYCYYICRSSQKDKLYVLHNKGLSVFNSKQEKVEHTYNLFYQSYSQGSSIYISQKGNIFVGGVNGLAVFEREGLHIKPSSTTLSFDKLYLFNREIRPNDETHILSEILSKTSGLKLSHDQNNIAIEFAAFNYRYDRNTLFEYKLDGFDKSWTQTNEHTIAYTNLPPGHYTLRLRQFESKELPSEEILMDIHVAAPFYATTLAYILYLLLGSTLIWYTIRFKTRQAALKSSLEFERKEKERIEELNQLKLQFFTNISHEFRTPLTLILAQIEMLMQMDKLGSIVYNRILRVHKNASQMRQLITELLDFQKLEQGHLKLKVEEKDLIAFTHEVYMSFYEYAQKKSIIYTFEHDKGNIPVWFDVNELQKVIFNVLANAFKYTPENGSIAIRIGQTETEATIIIADSGPGIAEKDLSRIFERFYQTENSQSSFSAGVGIGLALSKGIMDIHHGKIGIESVVGEGSTFTLTLQLGHHHFDKEDCISSPSETNNTEQKINGPCIKEFDIKNDEVASLPKENNLHKPTLLIVDDNEELLTMLNEVFQPIYDVHLAHNGIEGLEQAYALQPDLILSDVMMPEMSGKEMCYKLKNSVELSHIPIVLLTAQTSTDYIIEGYMFGADDYITKPFNVKILLARCNNLIKNKRRIMAYYAGKPMTDAVETDAMNVRDKELIEKSIRIVKANFDNSEFDVTTLATELCMGRSKLYLEFKEIIGLTPNEFILKVKLDEAMDLLKNRLDLNISEISVILGFSSPRYFSKCFKSFFGMTPQGVRKKIEDAN